MLSISVYLDRDRWIARLHRFAAGHFIQGEGPNARAAVDQCLDRARVYDLTKEVETS